VTRVETDGFSRELHLQCGCLAVLLMSYYSWDSWCEFERATNEKENYF